MARSYQICPRCVMDTSDPDIIFDKKGQCNHCRQYDELLRTYVSTGEEGQRKLSEMANRIKKAGQGKRYDCILGVSGGCDSSYVAYVAKQLGLQPYLVTLDNGYDTEEAKRNAKVVAKYLGAELHVHKIEYKEFKDLQIAYLKSGIINIEALTDHAIIALLWHTAAKLGVKYIVSGGNYVTEGILPHSWEYRSDDLSNILDIYKRYGSRKKLETFPTLSPLRLQYYQLAKGIQFASPLNYINYNKREAKELLRKELGWEDYGAKHCESVFTRFYQFHILPRRLNVDKRRAHLSCLICSGQMTREEALKELGKPPYNEQELRKDKEFVLERLGLTDEQFEELINLPVRSHLEFKTDESRIAMFRKALYVILVIRGGIRKVARCLRRNSMR